LQIESAIRRAIGDDDYRARVKGAPNVYGDGTAGKKIAAVIRDVAVDQRLIGKVNTF